MDIRKLFDAAQAMGKMKTNTCGPWECFEHLVESLADNEPNLLEFIVDVAEKRFY
jgi:hypothetical protein